MAERSDQRTRDSPPSDDIADFSVSDVDSPAGSEETAGDETMASSLRARLPSLPSGRMLLLTIIAFAALGVVGRATVPLVGGPLGLFVGAFGLGSLSERRRYIETAVAGGLLGLIGATLGNVRLLAITDAWVPLLGLGIGLGVLIALVGTYFGNDLRRGLLSDV